MAATSYYELKGPYYLPEQSYKMNLEVYDIRAKPSFAGALTLRHTVGGYLPTREPYFPLEGKHKWQGRRFVAFYLSATLGSYAAGASFSTWSPSNFGDNYQTNRRFPSADVGALPITDESARRRETSCWTKSLRDGAQSGPELAIEERDARGLTLRCA